MIMAEKKKRQMVEKAKRLIRDFPGLENKKWW